jgi:drug/metabolite transporter (DMT)-like permease
VILSNPFALGSLAMIGSALAHAGMTLMTKRAADRLVFRGLSLFFVGALFLPWLVFQPIPGWEVWRFLLASAFTTWAFNMLMLAAFERGEMNLIYPIMRGTAPGLAAIGAWVLIGESLEPLQMMGLMIAAAALVGFAWPESNGLPKATGMMFAIAASTMTASYTLIDASGVRASGNVLVYTGWFFVLSALTVGGTSVLRRGRGFLKAARIEAPTAAWSMSFNVITYGLAMFAYSIAPIGPMAALRETSVVFGAILAAIVLKEPFGARRIALAIVLAGGLVLIQVFR